jgi:hypothetical protein
LQNRRVETSPISALCSILKNKSPKINEKDCYLQNFNKENEVNYTAKLLTHNDHNQNRKKRKID